MSEADELLRAGDLPALRALHAGRVRAEPGQVAHRLALAETMILQGDLEKADGQLEIAATQDASTALPVALTRQLIRAATARDETFTRRRPPELVADADAGIAAAFARLAGAPDDEMSPALTATIDGRPLTGLRDTDDRTAEVLEVLTATGRYVWISLGQVAALTLHPPERPRDLVWRQAELEVRGGPTGVVYLPAIYHAATMTDAQRLGRETDWIEEGGVTRGVGLRVLLAGDDALAIGAFATLAVTEAVAG